MAYNKVYKVKVKSSVNEIEVYMILSGKNKEKYCDYSNSSTLYNKNELIFLDNGR